MFNAFGAAPVMGPWQGGVAQPVGPPSRPEFGSGALTLVSQTDAYVAARSERFSGAALGPISRPAPGELRSLISALSEVQRGCSHGFDPLWSELRDLAQEDVTARDSRRFW